MGVFVSFKNMQQHSLRFVSFVSILTIYAFLYRDLPWDFFLLSRISGCFYQSIYNFLHKLGDFKMYRQTLCLPLFFCIKQNTKNYGASSEYFSDHNCWAKNPKNY